MKSITFSCEETLAMPPEEIARQILDLDLWPGFEGYGPLPGIRAAEFEARTPEVVGTRIRVTDTDGSSHVEEIVEWEPDRRIRLRMGGFSPPLSRLATGFDETFEFERTGERTRVVRRFELHPKSTAHQAAALADLDPAETGRHPASPSDARGCRPSEPRRDRAIGPGPGGRAVDKVNHSRKLALFDDHRNPRIVGERNGQHVKLVKFRGEFVWHEHPRDFPARDRGTPGSSSTRRTTPTGATAATAPARTCWGGSSCGCERSCGPRPGERPPPTGRLVMTASDLMRRLHRHRMWVNHRLLEAVSPLGEEQLRRPLPIGQGSVWRTLTHLIAAESNWLEALLGNEMSLFPGDAPGKLPGNQEGDRAVASLDELASMWRDLDRRWDEYLAGLTDEALDEIVFKVSTSSGAGRRFGTRRSDVLLHVCTHAQYTTAQLVNMLRQLGVDRLPDVMLISMARQEAGAG